MVETEPPQHELLNKYRKITTALSKIPDIVSTLDNELANLNERDSSYVVDVLRIGETKHCLKDRAFPELRERKIVLEKDIIKRLPEQEQYKASRILGFARRKHLSFVTFEAVLINLAERHMGDAKTEDKQISDQDREISQKFDELSKVTGKKVFSVADIASVLGFKVYRYPAGNVVPEAKLIRGVARKLGIVTADKMKPNFSAEEVRRIINELAYTKIPQKDVESRGKQLTLVEDEKNTVLIRGKKIIFSESDTKEIRALRALAEASEENPISSSLLAGTVYGDEVLLAVAKNRISVILVALQERLGRYGLAIARKNTKEKGNLVAYYLVDKNNLVKTDHLEKKTVERKIPVENNVLNAGRKSEVARTIVPAINKSPNVEGKLDPSLLLNENEIFVIAKRLLDMEWRGEKAKTLLTAFNISTRPLNVGEMERFLNRTRVGLGKERNHGGLLNIEKRRAELDKEKKNKSDFEEENILSALPKLNAFLQDPKKYLNLCGEEARILLSCFESAKINNGFWEKLLEDIQPVPVHSVTEEMGLETEA